ncbi:MAG: 30S ribosomal protein S20 [Parcubacteria group bacterium]
MARKKAGLKALRVSKRHADRNLITRRRVREAIRVVRKALAAKKIEPAREAFKKMSSQLDRAAKTGVLHKRAAARYKSRLAQQIAKLAKPS